MMSATAMRTAVVLILLSVGTAVAMRQIADEGTAVEANGRHLQGALSAIGKATGGLVTSVTDTVQAEEDAVLMDLMILEKCLSKTSVGRRRLQQDTASIGTAIATLLEKIFALVQEEEDAVLADLKILEKCLSTTSIGK